MADDFPNLTEQELAEEIYFCADELNKRLLAAAHRRLHVPLAIDTRRNVIGVPPHDFLHSPVYQKLVPRKK